MGSTTLNWEEFIRAIPFLYDKDDLQIMLKDIKKQHYYTYQFMWKGGKNPSGTAYVDITMSPDEHVKLSEVQYTISYYEDGARPGSYYNHKLVTQNDIMKQICPYDLVKTNQNNELVLRNTELYYEHIDFYANSLLYMFSGKVVVNVPCDEFPEYVKLFDYYL